MRRDSLALILTAFSASSLACSDAPPADARTDADGQPQVAAVTPATAVSPETAPAAELSPIALRVPDMSCALCARPIEHSLRELGVRDVKADLQTKWVTGRFDPQRLTADVIRAKVEDLRFRVTEVRVS